MLSANAIAVFFDGLDLFRELTYHFDFLLIYTTIHNPALVWLCLDLFRYAQICPKEFQGILGAFKVCNIPNGDLN